MKVLVWPDIPNPRKISSLVKISIMLSGITKNSIPLPSSLVSKIKILLKSLSRLILIYLSRPVIRPFVGLRL